MYDAELEKAGATEDQDVAMADGGLDAVCREVVCKLYFEDHTQGNNPQKKCIFRKLISSFIQKRAKAKGLAKATVGLQNKASFGKSQFLNAQTLAHQNKKTTK